jgi:hypothetical protein
MPAMKASLEPPPATVALFTVQLMLPPASEKPISESCPKR